jgi:hypothetical protein
LEFKGIVRHILLILHDNKPQGSVKDGEYLERLSDYHNFKKASSPLSSFLY